MSDSKVVAITGASGLVGSALSERLEAEGWLVRAITRSEVTDSDRQIHWQPTEGVLNADELNGVDAVVHLAGENIAGGRWTKERKRRIVDSRVEGTRLLCETLAGLSSKPEVLVSASAIGFYGARGETILDEESPPGDGFLSETCLAWEHETHAAREAGIRVVNLRIGLVMSPEGGLLGKTLPLFKLGLGGVLGDGKQYMSWITREDLVAAIRRGMVDESLSGAVNATAPEPVTNRQFTKTLGRVLGRPTILPAPAFALRLAFGEMADHLMLTGARVLPKRLQAAGFGFEHPELEGALRELLGK